MDNADIRLDFGSRLECNFLKAVNYEASVKAAMRPIPGVHVTKRYL